MKKETWDATKNERIVMPNEMTAFLVDIEKVCQKHGLSISHEDTHGSFQIEEYSPHNIAWLYAAAKAYTFDNKSPKTEKEPSVELDIEDALIILEGDSKGLTGIVEGFSEPYKIDVRLKDGTLDIIPTSQAKKISYQEYEKSDL